MPVAAMQLAVKVLPQAEMVGHWAGQHVQLAGRLLPAAEPKLPAAALQVQPCHPQKAALGMLQAAAAPRKLQESAPRKPHVRLLVLTAGLRTAA